MGKTLSVQVKCVYGKELIYPVCEMAKKFTEITGNKTLPLRLVQLLKDLGVQITVINPERKF